MKKDLRLKTIELRKLGHSVKELHAEIGVSKSTISLWVQKVPLSKQAKQRLLDRSTKARIKAEETIREQTRQKNIVAEDFAKSVIGSKKTDKDIQAVLCSMIYLCEGSKAIKNVAFTNSDPSLIRTFISMFRNSFEVDESKFRILMHLHDYHDEQKQKAFWSQVTSIPQDQFYRTYKKESDHRYKKEGYEGCIKIYYNDVSISRKLHFIAKSFMERYK